LKRNKKPLRLGIVKAAAFLLIFVLLFQCATDLFRTKKFLFSLSPLYDLPRNSVDVLLLGSSHMNCGVSPMDLWHDYGITSFNAAIGDQTIPASYFELRELLKVQKPKVVVLETFHVWQTEMMTSSGEERLHWLVDNIPMSLGVSEAIQTLICEDHDKTQYYLNFYTFHNRWRELEKDDFIPNIGYNRGADMGVYNRWSTIEPPDIIPRFEWEEAPELAVEYLLKIIELCRENKINLVFMATPCRIGEHWQKMLNYVGEIAQQGNIPYLNFFHLIDEMQFDFAADMAEWSHMNYSGVRKVTAYLGEYLQTNYQLEDHRTSSAVAGRWNADYEVFAKALNNVMMKTAKNAEEYFDYLKGNDYVLIWNAYSETPLYETALPELLDAYGLSFNGSKEKNRYCAVTRAGKPLYEKMPDSKPSDGCMADDMYFSFGRNASGDQKPIDIYVGRTNHAIGNSGLNLAVYDPMTRTVLDSVNVDLNEKTITRK